MFLLMLDACQYQPVPWGGVQQGILTASSVLGKEGLQKCILVPDMVCDMYGQVSQRPWTHVAGL